MKILANSNKVKRARMTMNYDYLYYVKKPGKVTHDLLVTEFYSKLIKVCNVLQFKVEKELGNIRPDAIFAYELNNITYLGLLEVEISHKGFDSEKYDKFYRSNLYKNWFPVMPTVYVVCKSANIPKNTPINFICISTDMSDFKLTPH